MRTYYPGETKHREAWTDGGYTVQTLSTAILDEMASFITDFVAANSRIPTLLELSQQGPIQQVQIAPVLVALLNRGDLDPDVWPVQEIEEDPAALRWDPDLAEPVRPWPKISSLVRGDATPVDPEATVTWVATFDRIVTDVDETDFALVETGVEASAIALVAGADDEWTVTVTVGTLLAAADGSLGLNAAGQDIFDELGRHTNMALTGEVYVITYTPPPEP